METWEGDKNDGEVGGARVSTAAGGSGVEGRPTCCICMEPWTCDDAHRICCIPCGHVYGRSCLENWLSRCGNTSAKCPQCGKRFTLEHIINLYAPENLLDGCCSIQAIGASGSEADLYKQVLDIFLEPANRSRQHGVHIDEISKQLKLPRKKIWQAIEYNVDVGNLYSTIDNFHFKEASTGNLYSTIDDFHFMEASALDYCYNTQQVPMTGLNQQVLNILDEPANHERVHGVHIDEIIKRLKLPEQEIRDVIAYNIDLGNLYMTIDDFHYKLVTDG